jgi:uncharacterized SAM-binding protein YcdF (DUF218 family)
MINTECYANGDSKNASKTSGLRALSHSLIGLMAIVIGYLVIAYLTLGRYGIEKILTGLAMPVGIGWLLLTISVLSSWFRGSFKVNRWTQGIVWVLFTLCSTAPVPDYMMKTLESQVSNEFRPETDRQLDSLIVFGGSTMLGPKRAELTEAGDRVLYAAQLYLQGKTKRLIATGEETSQQTKEIWQQLKIPETDIVLLPGSVNTAQEIASLRTIVQQTPQRIGILSSANHLPRIQRLAAKAGLTELIPVAANHRSRQSKYTVIDFLPSATSLAKFSDSYKEWLAAVVGR